MSRTQTSLLSVVANVSGGGCERGRGCVLRVSTVFHALIVPGSFESRRPAELPGSLVYLFGAPIILFFFRAIQEGREME